MIAMTQQEEKIQIRYRYKNLLKSCKNIITEDDIKQVRKAFELSFSDNEKRDENVKPTVYRALEIAEIVVGELGLGRTSVICSMLYVVIQQGGVDVLKIESMFGSKVAQIVEGLEKVTEIYKQNPTLHTENFRKLLLSFADDVRVVLIILADRLSQLRNATNKPSDYQIALAEEISFLYIPLAHRLGMYQVKASMEDLSLQYLEPELYFELEKKLKDTEPERDLYIKNFVTPIREELDQLGLKYEIKARTKSIASILHKMKKQQVEFEEVYDIFAVRIIIDAIEKREKSECWQVYSMVSDLYRPNPKRMRDWITIPKSNGYESLHTTVMGLENRWVEVQIRSKRMDMVAENGFAAHWRYKGDEGDGGIDTWLHDIREILERTEDNHVDLIDNYKADLYRKEIYVFTPKGELKQLKAGSTLLDFAYSIHSDLGDRCVGGKVNQRSVSLRHVLNNGDQVSIVTSHNQKPKFNWLNFVVTTKAKNKIHQALKEETIKGAELGKEILMRRMKNWKIEFNDENIRKLLNYYKYKLAADLYCNIVNETHDLSEIKDIITDQKIEDETFVEAKREVVEIHEVGGEDVLIVDENIANVDYSLSKCCNPIFGDEIFGFISIGKGIRIHRASCPNAIEMLKRYPYRVVKSNWTAKGNGSYLAVLHVTGADNLGIANSITELITKDSRVQMRSMENNSGTGTDIFEARVTVIISNINHLNSLIAKLKRIKGIRKVSRYDTAL